MWFEAPGGKRRLEGARSGEQSKGGWGPKRAGNTHWVLTALSHPVLGAAHPWGQSRGCAPQACNHAAPASEPLFGVDLSEITTRAP